MDYEHKAVKQFWRGWLRAIRMHPVRTFMLLVGTCVFFSSIVVAVSFLSAWGTKLASVEKKVGDIDTTLQSIASALETLIVVQPINRIEADDSILLDFEPVPRSVKIVSGPLVDYPNPSYGYRLEGRRIHILNPSRLEELKQRAGTEGLTVEYIRQINLKK